MGDSAKKTHLLQGLAKGHNVPTVGAVQIAWYSGLPVKTAPVANKEPSPAVATVATDAPVSEPSRPRSPEAPAIHSPRAQEEEVVASGWGADSDGEDGMGML